MARSHTQVGVLTVLAAVALLAGCGPATTSSQPRPTESRPTANERPTTPSRPTGPGTAGTGGTPAPGVVLVFRVERDVVTIRPGGEARVKLLSVPSEGELAVTVDPPDSRLNAVADRDVLTIRAGDDATGESVVTVKAGNESARVTVKVQAEKE